MVAPGAVCANHPSVHAVETCERCGSFICANCMELEGYDAYCPDCYLKVGTKAPASAMATTAIVLAILSISGCFPLALPAAIIGHIELNAIERGDSMPGGRNLAKGAVYVGWIVTGLCVLGLLLFMLIIGIVAA